MQVKSLISYNFFMSLALELVLLFKQLFIHLITLFPSMFFLNHDYIYVGINILSLNYFHSAHEKAVVSWFNHLQGTTSQDSYRKSSQSYSAL